MSTDENTISDDQIGVVLEEAEFIDCDATSEGENIQYQLCEVQDNAVAYRVVQVNDNHAINKELAIATPANNTLQVLTSPINGQFYVLNGNEVLTSEPTSSVVPCVAKLQIEAKPNVMTKVVTKRDDRRRVTHNEVERRRRDKINNWITKLGKLLPESEKSVQGEGDAKTNFEAQSKGGILARACEYVTELRDVKENFSQSLDEYSQLVEEAKNLRQVLSQLRKENTHLKAQLAKNTDFVLNS